MQVGRGRDGDAPFVGMQVGGDAGVWGCRWVGVGMVMHHLWGCRWVGMQECGDAGGSG